MSIGILSETNVKDFIFPIKKDKEIESELVNKMLPKERIVQIANNLYEQKEIREEYLNLKYKALAKNVLSKIFNLNVLLEIYKKKINEKKILKYSEKVDFYNETLNFVKSYLSLRKFLSVHEFEKDYNFIINNKGELNNKSLEITKSLIKLINDSVKNLETELFETCILDLLFNELEPLEVRPNSEKVRKAIDDVNKFLVSYFGNFATLVRFLRFYFSSLEDFNNFISNLERKLILDDKFYKLLELKKNLIILNGGNIFSNKNIKNMSQFPINTSHGSVAIINLRFNLRNK